MIKKLFLLPLLLLALSCSQKEYSLLTVLTDQKDMVLIAEYYNKIQDHSRLNLVYDDYISPEDITLYSPDLVVGKDLNNRQFQELFIEIEKPEGIYPVLWGENDEDSASLLPLAFDMPIIVYKADKKNLPIIMDDQSLKAQGTNGNRLDEGDFIHMGFSPLWNPDFLYWYLRGKGVTFHSQEDFGYDQDKLSLAIQTIREWVETENQGFDKEKAFTQKYRYIPDYQLLKQGVIDYSAMTFTQYSRLPGKETGEMTFSWYGDGEHINPVNCLYGGIPKESNQNKRTVDFLYWILSVENQKELIKYKGIVSPGFSLFDRFSTLEEINRLHLPMVFSDKLGIRLFLEEQLGAPMEEPINWSAVKKDAIYPWLEETLWENNTLPLSSFYKEWQLQFID
ncbi:MAG: hypothetical protein PQJ59_14040 [Spirochaetales bacterium]|nr:hypothetical protein [Spirochaetales bacterium]